MAKQVAAQKTEVEPQEETVKQVFTKKIEEPIALSWEIKDRTYFLLGGKSPLTHTIPSKHTRKYSLLWFDSETGEQEELRYATNQTSPLVSKQKGEVTLGHIMFKNGTLFVPKEKQNLQKLLSLYHPLKDKVYEEFSAIEVAIDELDELELQLDALNAAREMELDQAEAILRVEIGSKVSKMSSKELKRDLLLFARKNPYLFLELANDDNVQLRNVAIRAAEDRIIILSQDQRTFSWAQNGRKLCTVPFNEHPYSALASWFKTDEGMEVYSSIEKLLN